MQAVAAPLARRPPKPSFAFALARLLGTGGDVAGAFEAAPPAPPARQAVAVPGEGVTVGAAGVALTLLLAGRCPPARLTAAGAGEGVAAAMGAAGAGELAELSPVVGVAGAAPARWVAAPVGVACAAPLAVGTPVLLRAAGTAVCSEEAGFAEANPRSHAHLVRPAGILPLAQRSRALPSFLLPARAARRASGEPADVPAVRVQLLGRALHPQPQLEAEDGPGAPHPSGARGPESLWLPSPTPPSVCPVCPVLSLPRCSLFLSPTLDFFLRKRGRRRPDPDVRGVAGRGRQGMPPHGLFLVLSATLAAEMGTQGVGTATAGAGACLSISPVFVQLPLCNPPSPLKLF